MTPDRLAALHAQCFETPRPWGGDEFASLLAAKNVFLRTTDAGFVLGRVIIDEAELLTLAVDPAHQRQGHGETLLAAFETEGLKRGAKTAFLEVAEDNIAARALYQSAGYSESGRRSAYYRPPQGAKIDAIILRKPLI